MREGVSADGGKVSKEHRNMIKKIEIKIKYWIVGLSGENTT